MPDAPDTPQPWPTDTVPEPHPDGWFRSTTQLPPQHIAVLVSEYTYWTTALWDGTQWCTLERGFHHDWPCWRFGFPLPTREQG